MLKRILLVLDSGERAVGARTLALQLAQDTAAEVTALALIDASPRLSGEAVPAGAMAFRLQRNAELEALALASEHELLQSFRELAQLAGVNFGSRLEETAHPAQVLREYANAHDLIVLAPECHLGEPRHAHDMGWLEEFLHDTARPVLLSADAQGSGPVVLAYDGSACSARTLQQFAWLGLASGAPLRVISVHHNQIEAERLAAEGAGYLAAHGLPAEAVGLCADGAAGTLLETELKRSGARLLVMGAFGHRSWLTRLFGSTTRKLLHHRVCPVLMGS
ncbi:universal stress protein [Craterilacuibacter sp.]|uniref:universal stress protein n=1 Tax=Craterilacuibacter sp. TaxID=2870909 RepID=UPI003F2EF4D3